MATRIAVVTGANKGIGFSIVKGLAQQFEGTIYLTARNEQLGINAVKQLEKENIKGVKFHQLDINDLNSVSQLAKHLKKEHNGLDVLVNNAAIAYKSGDSTPVAVQAKELIKTNYFGQLNVCNALFPHLRPHSRVVNVAARAGMLKFVKDESWRNQLKSESLTVDDLNKIMNQYVELAQTGKHKSITISPYNFSKVGLIALTKVHQREFNTDSRRDIIVNAVCPGLCKTDMTEQKGKITPDEGAETPVYLAMMPPDYDGFDGQMWAEKKMLDWTDLNWQWK